MAWSVRFLGKASAIRREFAAHRNAVALEDLGQFDAVAPHVLALVQANSGVELLDVRVNAAEAACSVSITPVSGSYVE